MRINLDVSDERFQVLWQLALRAGVYVRDDTRATWTDEEKCDCIKAWITYLADYELVRR
jgi:hypothetical protein